MSSDAASPKQRSWLPALGSLVFLFVLLEISLQGFYYATAGSFLFSRAARPIFAPNPYTGFWNRPNLDMVHNTNEFRTTLYTNSEGFRTSAAHEEYAVPKPPGKLRVLLLGPSFAFGWGVNYEDTFAARLEAQLDRAGYGGTREVELINAGVPSLSAYAQLHWFEEKGAKLGADLVIQFIYGSMALSVTEYQLTPDGYLVPKGTSRAQWLQSRLKQSATVFYGWIAYTRLRSLFGAEPASKAIQGAGRELVPQARFDPTSPELASSLSFYDELRTAVDGAGARLLVVYFPLAYTVHPEDLPRWRNFGVQNIETQKAFDDEFCRFLPGRGVPCENISNDLIRAAKESGDRVYYWLDIHWTPEGNRVAADAVFRRLAGTPTLPGGAGLAPSAPGPRLRIDAPSPPE